ncbi:MAG: hypothetical protein IJE63_02295, partial [Clostridia bacterium]|nr:hypothetical protein [Clostridia bacterium]
LNKIGFAEENINSHCMDKERILKSEKSFAAWDDAINHFDSILIGYSIVMEQVWLLEQSLQHIWLFIESLDTTRARHKEAENE